MRGRSKKSRKVFRIADIDLTAPDGLRPCCVRGVWVGSDRLEGGNPRAEGKPAGSHPLAWCSVLWRIDSVELASFSLSGRLVTSIQTLNRGDGTHMGRGLRTR
jgi:hypothetical protein